LFISVITPTFNSEKHILKNIESLNSQEKIFEQIIIDNKSNDKTIEIIKKTANYPFTIISEEDNGIYYAMNKGVSKAAGDYLLFLNSDDWLPENTFEIVEYEIKKNTNTDIFYGNTNYYQDKKIKFIQKSDINKILKTNSISHQTMYYSKQIFLKYKFDTKFKVAADYDLSLKLFKNHYKFHSINKTLSNNLMGGYSSNLLESFKDFFQIQKKNNGLLKAFTNSIFEYKFQIFKLIILKITRYKNEKI
tara:strand:+ start:25743 stop:26486 length:744 start_codon:yes stop_codon:yes gene_type:complete